ncbi:adenosylcobinamide-GDP ribazoletransferase [Cupriavidus pauculus]|jgi:adenosylcobinamide-GDP ribazoletransferase|uniref:adenosylcobinamide-GDP ribazoletransferase n=1 Tax=Cupriavidus pauculus TaxID=82633 RepID=UPI0007836CEA|nr:adenosylcobinamide-GDP ribazoletransferase [Cupriavidus pauculus]KAB0604357.1 adenosylcobinamide-GDP ribazoletransferase [Cupriavidus pauculus]MBY4731255.1 adenosylcobinamide-GDP ribazoletransferase [Cupriavidus pauculus]MCM3606514.1 adenosylcobinamide-GDP ribazoletransferase [Cupriavidus pauculus]UAL00600.1 adenosylcobinamide-GDP ribazoletransferase [Cupriavidus pauculus]
MADEFRFFLTAVGYFTRVPLPRRLSAWVGFEPHYLNAAARYFALVGLLVGAAGALATWAAWQVWSPPVAVVLGMAATLLLTGAFHEDGLADCVDAFGGGYRREDVLAIMHDSRVGAFGAIAIVIALLLKWQLLVSIGEAQGVEALLAVLIAAHGASRAMAITFLATHDYVRPEGKAKPVAQRLAGPGLLLALACGVLPLLWVSPLFAGVAILVLAALRAALGAYFVRRIGGYTGDCLGMAQQLAELSIYLVAAAWKWY